MASRRNPRRAAAKSMSLAELAGNNDDDDDSNPASTSEEEEESSEEESLSDDDQRISVKKRKTSTRTSSRTTRFQSSMQEPKDSIKDLLDGKSEYADSPRKSPAKRHSSARRKVRTEVHVDSSESSDESEQVESDEDEEDVESLKIQRIIASRSEPRKVWKEICSKMHTSEIQYGSRWFQESDQDEKDENLYEERFLVKWSDMSYMHCSWETQQDLVEQVEGAKSYLSTFFKKAENGLLFTADERCDGDYFDPAFVQVDRILDVDPPDGMKELPKERVKDEEIVKTFGIILDRESPDFDAGTGRQFLVKWKNTPYSDATFEFERDLILNEVEYLDDLKALEDRSRKVRFGRSFGCRRVALLASQLTHYASVADQEWI